MDLIKFIKRSWGDETFAKRLGWAIKTTIESKTYKPPLLPETAVRLSEMASRRDCDVRDVENVVKQDPIVAAHVLSVANSAFYSRRSPTRTLKAAITRLGITTVRDVAFKVVAQTQIFKVPGYVDRMRELFQAAQAAGTIAKQICRILRFESELAYLCGLLHDMGEAMVLNIITNNEPLMVDGLPPLSAVEPAVTFFHGTVGARICDLWGLPPLIVDAVRFHHQPERSANSSQMTLVVAVTDMLLKHAGIGVPPEPIEDPLEHPRFFELNLSPNQVKDLLAFAENVAESEGE